MREPRVPFDPPRHRGAPDWVAGGEVECDLDYRRSESSSNEGGRGAGKPPITSALV